MSEPEDEPKATKAEDAGQAESGDGPSNQVESEKEPAPSGTRQPAVRDEDVKRRVNVWVLAVGGLIVLSAAAAVFFALRFVDDERERDLRAWQIRLGIVADSRVAAVNGWVEENFAILRELAENASLQLYMTELALAEGDAEEVTDEAAQASYLRNLLIATADRAGFQPPPEVGEVAANVEKVGVAGIGLVDKSGAPIVSTPGMPPIAGRVRDAVKTALKGEPALIDVYMGASNQPSMGFVLPIFGLQDEGVEGIGAVVGVRLVGEGLFQRLLQPGETEATAETFLVRAKDGTVEYLSPLRDDTPPLTRSMAADTPDLAAAFALAKPGGFSIKRDYAGDEVLVTSRALAALPWSLVRKVTRSEALSGTETRLKTILIVFGLIIGGVLVTLIAVWKHGSSLRAEKAAEQYRIAAERFENLIQFMRVVTDSQPTHILCLNPDNQISFANRPFADHYGIPITDIRFKPLSGVIGPVKANAIAEINKRVIEDGEHESHLHRFEDESGVQVVTTDHVHIPADSTHPPAALTVIHDITELSKERERNEFMMRQLIDTLVSVVDRRDPYSANHSARVAEVARAIAGEMGLDEMDAKTVDIAGSLMSLAKIFVPPEILTKAGDLSPAERKLVANNHLTSAELLQNVPFDGPVVETIRQMGETWDGSGPLSLSEENILRTARVLAVANAFVGMISPRAYRDALTFEKVSNFLLQDSGTKYDRKPVSALINFLENRGGIETWAHFRERPQERRNPRLAKPRVATKPAKPAPRPAPAVSPSGKAAPAQPAKTGGPVKVRVAHPRGSGGSKPAVPEAKPADLAPATETPAAKPAEPAPKPVETAPQPAEPNRGAPPPVGAAGKFEAAIDEADKD